MNGRDLALKVIEQYPISDIEELARQAGCTIIYEKWHLTTWGEFHKKTNTIYVNLNAPIPKEHIIAHELGHFFSKDKAYSTNQMEIIAEDFAKCLLNSLI